MNDKIGTHCRSFAHPDEMRAFREHGRLEVIQFDDGTTVGRGTFEPGWRWSSDVKPLAQTASCEADHTGFCLSGTMSIRMDDGHQFTIHAGDAFHIPPGHDAWVEGKETCVLIDVRGFRNYAKKAA